LRITNPTKITVNGIVGKNKKFLVIDSVGNGNIEDLLEKISPMDYNAAKSYVSQQIGDNKPMTAFEFMRRAIKKTPIVWMYSRISYCILSNSVFEADPLHSELKILDWIFYRVRSNEIKRI